MSIKVFKDGTVELTGQLLENASQKSQFLNDSSLKATSLNEYCYKTTNDGSKFLLIFSHSLSFSSETFKNKSESKRHLTDGNRFSILNVLERKNDGVYELADQNNKFEFLIDFPSLSSSIFTRWRQKVNPLESVGIGSSDMGFELISDGLGIVEYNGTGATRTPFNQGIVLSSNEDSLIDWKFVNSASVESEKFTIGLINSEGIVESGFLLPNGTTETIMKFWVRVDNTGWLPKTQVGPDYMITENYLEKIFYHTISYSVENCTILPLSQDNFEVIEGKDFTFKIVPSTGYQLGSNVVVKAGDSVLTGANGEYTISSVMSDLQISVSGIEKQSYTISTSGTTYTITPISHQTNIAEYGDNFTFKITPSTGYQLGSSVVVKANDTTLTAVNGQYTISNISSNISIIVSGIEKIKYTVSYSSETYTITPVSQNNFEVEHGDSFTFKVVPNDGYIFGSNVVVKAGSTTLTGTSDHQYTVSSVTSNILITVVGIESTIRTYTISAANSTYTISPTSQTGLEVEEGSDFTFKVVPASGYAFNGPVVVSADGAELEMNDSQYTLSSVSKNTSVSVSGISTDTSSFPSYQSYPYNMYDTDTLKGANKSLRANFAYTVDEIVVSVTNTTTGTTYSDTTITTADPGFSGTVADGRITVSFDGNHSERTHVKFATSASETDTFKIVCKGYFGTIRNRENYAFTIDNNVWYCKAGETWEGWIEYNCASAGRWGLGGDFQYVACLDDDRYYYHVFKSGTSHAYRDHALYINLIEENSSYETAKYDACCFAAGTSILLADGSEKNIEEIQTGDMVQTYNFATKKNEETKVIGTVKRMRREIVRMKLENFEKEITFTQDHPIYTKRGWVSADPEKSLLGSYSNVNIESAPLNATDEIFIKGIEFVKIGSLSIEILADAIETFTIDVEKNDNFYAEGVLAHNAASPC